MNNKNKNLLYVVLIIGSLIYGYFWWKKMFRKKPKAQAVAAAVAPVAPENAPATGVKEEMAAVPVSDSSGTVNAAAAGENSQQQSEGSGGNDVKLFLPKSARNPFISVADYASMESERKRKEEEARRKREEEERRKNPGKPKPAPVSALASVKAKVMLQGIVGSEAIVNGSVIRVGSTFKVDGSIVKFTALKGGRAWFQYGNATFYKDIQ